jgi:hypothetical protein
MTAPRQHSYHRYPQPPSDTSTCIGGARQLPMEIMIMIFDLILLTDAPSALRLAQASRAWLHCLRYVFTWKHIGVTNQWEETTYNDVVARLTRTKSTFCTFCFVLVREPYRISLTSCLPASETPICLACLSNVWERSPSIRAHSLASEEYRAALESGAGVSMTEARTRYRVKDVASLEAVSGCVLPRPRPHSIR